MDGREMQRTLLSLVVTWILGLSTTLAGVSGVGATPLGPQTTAMWLLDESDSPIFVAFFVGDENWNSRKWKSDFKFDPKKDSEAYYHLISDDLTLSIRISSNRKRVFVQDEKFKLNLTNVFIVDVRVAGSVTSVGHFAMPEASVLPAPVALLEQAPELAYTLNDELSTGSPPN